MRPTQSCRYSAAPVELVITSTGTKTRQAGREGAYDDKLITLVVALPFESASIQEQFWSAWLINTLFEGGLLLVLFLACKNQSSGEHLMQTTSMPGRSSMLINR